MPKKTKLSKYEDRITEAQITRAKRNTIRETISGVLLTKSELEGYLDNVIITLQNISQKCKEQGYDNVYIDMDYNEDRWGTSSIEVSLQGEKKETDDDVRRRLASRLRTKEETKALKREQDEKEIETIKKLAAKHKAHITWEM